MIKDEKIASIYAMDMLVSLDKFGGFNIVDSVIADGLLLHRGAKN